MINEHFVQRRISLTNKLSRVVWIVVYASLFRTSPTPLFGWRRSLLRLFGAKIAPSAKVYPSAKIWAPWNLVMDDASCISRYVDVYSVDKITIGLGSTISQYSTLCTASHDYMSGDMTLVTAPITIGKNCWLAYGVFVNPGVSISDASVVYARSVVTKNTSKGSVIAGAPAKHVRKRNNGKNAV